MSQNNKENLDSIWEKYRNALTKLDWALEEILKLRKDIKQKDIEISLRSSSEGGTMQVRDHLGNPINIFVPGQAPTTVNPKKPPPKLPVDYGNPEEKETDATFGNDFPGNPGKGDLCLRTDFIPFKLYKWNGLKWIELDRISTDRFAYNEGYIKYLISRIQSGEYDQELLTGPEEEQVKRYLNGK